MSVKPPTPDNNAAIDFLVKWSKDGPWLLTAITTDRKAITTLTFGPKNRPALVEFLEEHNGNRNIYFHVNPTIKNLSKKARREDIKKVICLHVDIDPRAGEDLKEEQERCLALLTTKLPEGVPPPTVIIFSGGGYQAFWWLEEPIHINGDLKLAEDAKRYNQQLERLFGADNCHNIDRIMRLPGTINIPDTRKLKKGRKRELAKIIKFDNEGTTYPLSCFTPATLLQDTRDMGFVRGGNVHIPSDVERLHDVDELDQWNVSNRVKIIIVQGRHPEETKEGDDSRSGWVFDAVCQMLRANVPYKVIFSILTDPDFGISESILDKGANAGYYAARQIDQAKEEIIDPWLRKLNDKYAVVLHDGGKCRVIKEVMDYALNRPHLMRINFQDFRNAYRNKKVCVGTNKKGHPIEGPVGNWWLEHPLRREYETIVFAPNQEFENVYNLWRGFACEAESGNRHEKFLEHIKGNICGDNKEYYDYVINWMARAVQKPDSQGETAIALQGARGTGKSFFAKNFGKIFGRHFLQVSNSLHLVGNFNAHLRDCVVLFADEAFYAGDKRHSSILKTLITEETLVIEAKGHDAVQGPNYTHLIMASNDAWVVPAGSAERRFLVLDVSDARQKDTEYFGLIQEDMDAGGMGNLLHFLLNVDLSEFDVRQVPNTPALMDQKLRTLKNHEHYFIEMLMDGMTPDPDEIKDHPAEVSVRGFLNGMGLEKVRGLETIIGLFIKKYAETDAQGKAIITTRCVNNRKLRIYKLKPLSELRKIWAEYVENWPLDGDAWRFNKVESGNQKLHL